MMKSTHGLNVWKAVALVTLILGIALVAYMVAVEGEPGALPLAMVSGGAIGYLVAIVKSRGPDT